MSDLPAEVQGWIGQKRYEQEGEFDVERGYIFTTCSSTENANPIYWEEKAANEITDGFIALPSMISVWFRPHHWAPKREEQVLPLQVHFDLKAIFDLPEAVMSDNTVTFGEPVRPGDRLRTWQTLRSCSGEKKTKLGTGRFWDIDVEYVNQRGEWVGTDSYTGYGYRRD
ncbi:MAG: MaoC family dehydratase N-terminal domain-containing protein [Deltaproteobacteria bacterium]|nr:MaoC family dehydratase N-terminal domain-containing protein [Deltaproteobacteria bacterium]MBW2359456.1 MaoC family dehydratase N-terminal domain-containing protein [Deltaproteobacteria bacterium]